MNVVTCIRRVWALGSAALLLALLTACAGSDGDSSAATPVRRVALMHVGTDHVPASLGSLKARLKELGWTEGRNIKFIWRNMEPGVVTQQAVRFVRERVDVIVAFEDQSIYAAQSATARKEDRIPIVFLHPSDPVRDGLVTSLSHPGGNMTGVFGVRDVVAKQLELYQLLVPRLHRVLTLVDPEDPATLPLTLTYRNAAEQLPRPLELDFREASTANDLRRIFRSLKPGETDGAFLLSTRLRLNYSALTIRLAARAGIPVQSHWKHWVKRGALFSYGADLRPIGRTGARYVDRILRGTPPADLAVQVVPKVEFTINLKTAGKLGLKPSQDMIIRADEVYR